MRRYAPPSAPPPASHAEGRRPWRSPKGWRASSRPTSAPRRRRPRRAARGRPRASRRAPMARATSAVGADRDRREHRERHEVHLARDRDGGDGVAADSGAYDRADEPDDDDRAREADRTAWSAKPSMVGPRERPDAERGARSAPAASSPGPARAAALTPRARSARSSMWCAVRSASAAVVICGGAPSEVGKTLMSATKRPAHLVALAERVRPRACAGRRPCGRSTAGASTRSGSRPCAHAAPPDRREVVAAAAARADRRA